MLHFMARGTTALLIALAFSSGGAVGAVAVVTVVRSAPALPSVAQPPAPQHVDAPHRIDAPLSAVDEASDLAPAAPAAPALNEESRGESLVALLEQLEAAFQARSDSTAQSAKGSTAQNETQSAPEGTAQSAKESAPSNAVQVASLPQAAAPQPAMEQGSSVAVAPERAPVPGVTTATYVHAPDYSVTNTTYEAHEHTENTVNQLVVAPVVVPYPYFWGAPSSAAVSVANGTPAPRTATPRPRTQSVTSAHDRSPWDPIDYSGLHHPWGATRIP